MSEETVTDASFGSRAGVVASGAVVTFPRDSLAAERAADAEANLAECLRRIARHDQVALGALYDATARRVYAVALRIMGNIQAAEEVVSDVYFQVWNRAAHYDAGRGPVCTWLLVICRSRALDAIRRRDDSMVSCEGPVEVPDPAGDPLEIIEAMEDGSRIQEALRLLTPMQRQLVTLAFFRGLSHSEIAIHSGLPLGSVKTHVRSALKVLRGALRGVWT